MSRRRLFALALLAAAGCSGSDGSDGSDPGTAPVGFGTILLRIAGVERCAWLAATDAERGRGLMEVTDLDGKAGMLFRFETDHTGGFWMRNTPTPLTIAFVSSSGSVVSVRDMAPCGDLADCPSYEPGAAYRYALEVFQDGGPALAVGDRVEVLAEGC